MSVIPTAASAAAIPYDLWVGGVQVDGANCDDIPGFENGKASFDPDTNTLTLTGVSGPKGTKEVEDDDDWGAAILNGLSEPLTINGTGDEGRLLENKVFFEFIRRGYDLYNGKIGRDEVHLIATKEHERVYVQVASKFDVDKEDSLIATLRKIRDHHPKLIIAFGEKTRKTRDGIMILNAMEFLMGASWSR